MLEDVSDLFQAEFSLRSKEKSKQKFHCYAYIYKFTSVGGMYAIVIPARDEPIVHGNVDQVNRGHYHAPPSVRPHASWQSGYIPCRFPTCLRRWKVFVFGVRIHVENYLLSWLGKPL
jgi:hypothetical protein